MNKRDLAGVLVKAVGAWMITFGLLELIVLLWDLVSPKVKFDFHGIMLILPMLAFLRIAIGLHLFFKGAWIADKLVQVDAHDD
jgi:hypothetical protein